MTKRTSSKKTVAEVLASIDPIAENSVAISAIDHHTQDASWTPPVDHLDTAELDAVLASLDQEAPPALETDHAPVIVNLPQVNSAFDTITTELQIDDEAVNLRVVAIEAACSDREAFETKKNPDNNSIQSTLKKVRGAFVTKFAAKVMLATNTSPDFINRSIHNGTRFNVYSLGKAADIMKAITSGTMSNAINIACMKSLFLCRAAGVPYTGEMAKASASKGYVIDAALRKHLVRHTVDKGTAPTQASSTMQALVTLGICKQTGPSRSPVYELTDHPIVKVLEDQLMKAA